MKKNWNKPVILIIGNSTVKGDGNPAYTYEDVCIGACITTNGCVVAGSAGCTGTFREYDTGASSAGVSCGFQGGATSPVALCS